MSQQRTKKECDPGTRSRGSRTKASGDAVTISVPEKLARSKSRSKIPKSVRLDLENALVSLCDVWFEKIKPHLIRNKIKLHHINNGAVGDKAGRSVLGCSHLDSGAASDHRRRRVVTCADSCSTPATASRAQCRKPPVSAPLPRPASTTQNTCVRSQGAKQRRRRRRKDGHVPISQTNWRVPRLCHTYSIITPRTHCVNNNQKIIRSPTYTYVATPKLKAYSRNKLVQTELSINPRLTKSSPAQVPGDGKTSCKYKKPRLRTVDVKKPTTICAKNIVPAATSIPAVKSDKKINFLFVSPTKVWRPCSSISIKPSLETTIRKTRNPWR